MNTGIILQTLLICVLCLSLGGGCASSDVTTYSGKTPEQIAAEVKIVNGSALTDPVTTLRAPSIDIRAGYGQFAKGMLSGGSNFGSAVFQEATKNRDNSFTHRLIVRLDYTNLGGIYREYDRAAIAGISKQLSVKPIERHKDITINGVNMTETIAIDLDESTVEKGASTGMLLEVSNASGNLEKLEVPANYTKGYLVALSRLQ